jgi:hypothetical protein
MTKPGPVLGTKYNKHTPGHTFSPTLKQVEFVRLLIIESLESCGYALVRKANTNTLWHPLDEVICIELERYANQEHWRTVEEMTKKKDAA